MTKRTWGQNVTLPESFILKDYKITVPVTIDIEWLHVAAIGQVGVNQVCMFGYDLYDCCFVPLEYIEM